MFRDDTILLGHAEQYAHARQIKILKQGRLGHGSDGAVWPTDRESAVKALYEQHVYRKELECYRRLKKAGISRLGGFDIPVLEGSDDSLLVIEMTIVEAPYLLDFGKVYLDRPPTYLYDRDMMKRVYEEWRERFGKQWTDVQLVIKLLERYGIYYYDPRPSNIDTGVVDDDDEPYYPPDDGDEF
jgi:hypothetical protein